MSSQEHGKRGRDESGDSQESVHKHARLDFGSPSNNNTNTTGGIHHHVLRPYPYFYYRDYSQVPDPDLFQPLTPPGRVPNFPAKMMSILSRPELADVVAWMPHGRAWRVLKPREFEIRVIPTYFEHAKFSSFIRQANGWGFRRITQGRDRNSYYNELFLRGLPHLCKMMKRHGVSEKQAADPEHEPDFYKISEENPVPEKTYDESILLPCTLEGGPKARMPVSYLGSSSLSAATTTAAAIPPMNTSLANPQKIMSQIQPNQSRPSNNSTVAAAALLPQPITFQHHQFNNLNSSLGNNSAASQQQQLLTNTSSQKQPAVVATTTTTTTTTNTGSTGFPPPPPLIAHHHRDPHRAAADSITAAALQVSSAAAASQFAAGFAAATALSQHQFQNFCQALVSLPPSTTPTTTKNNSIINGAAGGEQQQQRIVTQKEGTHKNNY